ncbi:MAG: DUF1080 domain-containing protein [Verrucomicrobiota bacterium]
MASKYVILVILTFASVTSGKDDWEVLFNGKDLSGWRTTFDDKSFKVVDGVICANAVGKKMNHLYYAGDKKEGFVRFKNFELQLEARSEANSNSGIFFHTDTSPRNNRYMLKNGYEVQLNSSKKEQRKTGSLYRVVDLERSVVDESKWFSVTIKVVDKHITVAVDGKLIVEYTQPPYPRRAKNHEGKLLMPDGGAIALQAHDPASVFYFRKIRVKRLP